eukprot:gene41055-50801_t
MAEGEDVDSTLINEFIPLFRLPRLTLLYVSVTMVGRGLPLDCAEILCPLEKDLLKARVQQCHKERFQTVKEEMSLTPFPTSYADFLPPPATANAVSSIPGFGTVPTANGFSNVLTFNGFVSGFLVDTSPFGQ